MSSLPNPNGAAAASPAANSRKPRGAPHLDHGGGARHFGNPWFLALTALGVVYGDIGTSPLYAFQVALTGIGHPVPTPHEVFGIVSLIFWALMLMVSLKYVVFVLRADNEGEVRLW
jgi:KUP system potassium uptake protein